MIETAKKAFYAAVGAPVVTAKAASSKFNEMTGKVKEYGDKVQDEAREGYETWADEGEKIVTRISDQPVVEDITSRIDIEEQVGKLREQLDDMLTTWRSNFRPEEPVEKITVEAEPTKKPAAKKTTAKKTTAKKTTAKKTAAKKPAAKKTTAAAKKPAAKKPAETAS